MRKLLAALAAAAVTLALSAATAAEKKPMAVLFKDANGKGASLMVDGTIRDLGSFNDKASSIMVVSGRFEVCEDAAFRGTCLTFGQGLHSLGKLSDRASSIRPVGAGSAGAGSIVVFTEKNGGGKSLRLTSQVANLSDYSGFNDQVSSVAIFSGTWKLCRSKNYGGGCTKLKPGVYNLDSYDNSVSSLQPQN